MTLLRAAKRLRHPDDVRLFLQILATILVLPGRIKRKDLPDLLRDLDPGVASDGRNEDVMRRTVKIVDMLLGFRPLLRYGKCFLRSLTLFRFLRRQGWPVGIRFGVRPADSGTGDLTGHSWLVLNGMPFLEPPDQGEYYTTYTYPEAGAPGARTEQAGGEHASP